MHTIVMVVGNLAAKSWPQLTSLVSGSCSPIDESTPTALRLTCSRVDKACDPVPMEQPVFLPPAGSPPGMHLCMRVMSS